MPVGDDEIISREPAIVHEQRSGSVVRAELVGLSVCRKGIKEQE